MFTRIAALVGGADRLQIWWPQFCEVLLLIPPLLACGSYLVYAGMWGPPRWVRRLVASRAILFLAISASLFAFRFPALLMGELNPDESQFLAAAWKLLKDPMFFRSVDCGTSGPLNIFPLVLPAALGISPDYATGRIIGILILIASIFILYRSLCLLVDEIVARFAILPVAGWFAVLRNSDLVHYSSEDVSLLLASVAVYAAIRIFQKPATYTKYVLLLGFLVSATFFAKMQALPILLCVTVFAVARLHRAGEASPFWRPYALLSIGPAALFVLNLVVCVAAGVWHDFWMAYIVANSTYVSVTDAVTPTLSQFIDFALNQSEIRWMAAVMIGVLSVWATQTLRGPRDRGHRLFLEVGIAAGIAVLVSERLLREPGIVNPYLGIFAALMASGSFLFLWREADSNGSAARWYGLLLFCSLIAASAAAYAPHRPYAHYLLLLIIPLALATSWPLVFYFSLNTREAGEKTSSHEVLVFLLVFVIVVLTGQLVLGGSREVLPYPLLTARIGAPEGEVISALTHPQGQISVWGWNARPYLSSGRTPATRDTNMANFFRGQERVDSYYRARYLKDLKRTPAEMFIDAADTSLFGAFTNRMQTGFILIPEIRAYVATNYVFVARASDDNLYIRRDLALSQAGIMPASPCNKDALGCFVPGPEGVLPADLPPVQIPDHAIVEIVFVPEGRQDASAIVFGNQPADPAPRGLQLQCLGGDIYRVAVGTGSEWRYSRPLTIQERTQARLLVEIKPDSASVTLDGALLDRMELFRPVANSSSPVVLGAGSDHKHVFIGNIRLFQIYGR